MLILAIAAWSLYAASSLSVFRAWEGERKYPPGRRVRPRPLPGSAFVLAAQHSGSLRYYSHRPTLRWDLLDPAWLDRALRSMRAAGYDPFLVVDTGEDEEFRQRFSGTGQRAVEDLAPLAPSATRRSTRSDERPALEIRIVKSSVNVMPARTARRL